MEKSNLEAAFVERLSTQALESDAVHHPYLRALRSGDLPDIEWALKDFAYQYGVYSSGFTGYLSAVITRLSTEKHRNILQENLAEEQGNPHDIELPSDILASIQQQPHSRLYQRFQLALGIDEEFRHNTPECSAAINWRQQFQALCEQNEYVGLGAIGIGTELIVSSIYRQILESLISHSHLTRVERIFFELHSECDDDHAAQIALIVHDLAQTPTACEQIEYGVNRALETRSIFWNAMLERALSCPASSTVNVVESSVV